MARWAFETRLEQLLSLSRERGTRHSASAARNHLAARILIYRGTCVKIPTLYCINSRTHNGAFDLINYEVNVENVCIFLFLFISLRSMSGPVLLIKINFAAATGPLNPPLNYLVNYALIRSSTLTNENFFSSCPHQCVPCVQNSLLDRASVCIYTVGLPLGSCGASVNIACRGHPYNM